MQQKAHAQEKQKFSLAAHLINSRLQLIRDKLDYFYWMDASQLWIRNRKYFDRAVQAVQLEHNIKCESVDYIDAAILCTMSLNPDAGPIMWKGPGSKDENRYAVEVRTRKGWIRVKGYSQDDGFELADPREILDRWSAGERFLDVLKAYKENFRIVKINLG